MFTLSSSFKVFSKMTGVPVNFYGGNDTAYMTNWKEFNPPERA
ncbi:hypothetical protein [Paenibacillus sp. FSL R7-0337]|nr:hypothetical protein [Paenibacillus sp. FSL R7-0337]